MADTLIETGYVKDQRKGYQRSIGCWNPELDERRRKERRGEIVKK